MQINRRAAIVGLLVGVGLVAYAIFAPASDDELIRKRLDELAAAVQWDRSDGDILARGIRVQKSINEVFLATSTTHIPDLPTTDLDRDALRLVASDVRRFETLTLVFKNTEIRLADDKASAEVKTDAVLTASGSGELDVEQRRVAMEWRKADGTWRILSATVPDRSREQPEARP